MTILFDSKHPDVLLRNYDALATEVWKFTGADEITAVSHCPENYPDFEVFTETIDYFVDQLDQLLNEDWRITRLSVDMRDQIKRLNPELAERISNDIKE